MCEYNSSDATRTIIHDTISQRHSPCGPGLHGGRLRNRRTGCDSAAIGGKAKHATYARNRRTGCQQKVDYQRGKRENGRWKQQLKPNKSLSLLLANLQLFTIRNLEEAQLNNSIAVKADSVSRTWCREIRARLLLLFSHSLSRTWCGSRPSP